MKLKHIPINYGLLAKAQDFYASRGYEYIETPWIVDTNSSNFTYAGEHGKFILNNIDLNGMWSKHLVGSAEQGFIDILFNSTQKLESEKKYMSISPCFRKGEDDETHCEQFMKLELFQFSNILAVAPWDLEDYIIENGTAYTEFLTDALECFKMLGLSEENLKQEKLFDTNIDIMFTKNMNLELGSYGYRVEHTRKMTGNLYRVLNYGTGLALPRFQLATS